MRYALKNTAGEILRHQDFTKPPPTLAPEKGMAWEIDPEPPPKPPGPAEVKAARGRKADQDRERALYAGFVWDNVEWHCDPVFQSQITGFVLGFDAGLIPADATLTIRSRANTNHQFTKAMLYGLATALMQHVQTIYAANWTAKDAP